MIATEETLPTVWGVGNVAQTHLDIICNAGVPKAKNSVVRPSTPWQNARRKMPLVLCVCPEEFSILREMKDVMPYLTIVEGEREITIFLFSDLGDMRQKLSMFKDSAVVAQLIRSVKTGEKDGVLCPIVVIHTTMSSRTRRNPFDVPPAIDKKSLLPFTSNGLFRKLKDWTFRAANLWQYSYMSVCKKLRLERQKELSPPIWKQDLNPALDLKRGFTLPVAPLYVLIQEGHHEYVEEILERGSDMYDDDEEQLLSSSIEGAHSRVIELLLRKGFRASPQNLCKAAKYGRVHAMRVLMKEDNLDYIERVGQLYGYPALVQMATKHIKPRDVSPVDRKSCEKEYNETWKEVTENILKIKDAQKLRQYIKTNISFIHYQDKEGLTPLHVAAREGHEMGVKELLDLGSLPTAKTYDNKTPADVADSHGFKAVAEMIRQKIILVDKMNKTHSQVAKRYIELLHEISRGGVVSVSDETDKETRLEQVRHVTTLLLAGTPLQLYGSFVYNALLLAISTNSRHLLPLLLAAGAPLTASTSGFGPIQLAAITPGVTLWVNVVLTRAMKHKLQAELKLHLSELDHPLKSGVKELLDDLEGDAPWKAIFRSDPKDLPQLLVTASGRGATTTAWWIWQAAKSSTPLTLANSDALHAALSHSHHDTARTLVNDMGYNPFVKFRNKLLFDMMPDELQQQLLQDFLAKEYKHIYKRMAKARYQRNTEKVRELQKLVITHIFLHCLSKAKENHSFGHPLLEELLEKSEYIGFEGEEPHTTNEEWITSLLKSLDGEPCHSEPSLDNLDEAEDKDYWDLHEYIAKSLKKRESQPVEKCTKTNLSGLSAKALKVCSEDNLTALLYLLVILGNVDVNAVIDPLCGTQALHHAALKGHLPIATSLVDFGCSIRVQDKNGNTPAHYAFMTGHEDLGKLLSADAEDVVNVCNMKPLDVFKSYQTYLQKESLYFENINECQIRYMETDTLISNRLQWLRKKWSQGDLKNLIEETHVDFTKGESLEIKNNITSLIQNLVTKIGKRNKFFEGKLVLVGSAADNTRQFCPDEYDFNLVLTNVSGGRNGDFKLELKDFPKGHINDKYIELSVENNKLRNLFHKSNFVNTFYNTAKACLGDLNLSDTRLFLISPGITKTQVGINLSLAWMGKEFPLMMVDVDVVPTLEAPWPLEHPRPSLEHDRETVYLNNMTDSEWRFSFGLAETSIMSNLSDDKRRVFLGCKLILSSLKASWWAPQEVKRHLTFWDKKIFRVPVPAGFVLKNVFFKEIEEMDGADEWREPHLLDRMISIFRRMCEDPDDPECRMPRKVMAYFGGATQTPSFARGAPEILAFLKTLKDVDGG